MNNLAGQQLTTSVPVNGAGDPPPHPGFDAPAPAAKAAMPAKVFDASERSQATQIEQARAIAEVQAQVFIAQDRPRNVQRAISEMREVCAIPGMADRAFFKYSRGGSAITGATVHLARELARIWGNVDFGIKELARSDARGVSEMYAYAWDLQTNARPTNTFIVPHARDTNKGVKPLTDMRDIYENNANMGARRLRECIFAILPKWFTDEAEDICRATLVSGGGKPIAQRIADMMTFAKTLKVTQDMVEKREGCKADALTDEHLADLRILFRSLKNGEITREEAFPESLAADVDAALRGKASAAAVQSATAAAAVDKTAAAQAGAGPSPAPAAEASPSPSPTPATVDHAATLKVIQSRMVKAGSLATVDATVADFAEEIDLMRTEAPAMYADAMAAINGKREAFKA